jgi:hypothetical protein
MTAPPHCFFLFLALLPSEWGMMGRFSDGLEQTGQDFQAEIFLIA